MKVQSEESKLEAICTKMGIMEQYNKLYDNPAQKEVYAVNADLTTGAIKELLKCMPNETVIKLVEAKYEKDTTKMSISTAYQLAGEKLKKLKNISEENLEDKIFQLRTKKNSKKAAKSVMYSLPKMLATPQQIEEQNNFEPPEEEIPED